MADSVRSRVNRFKCNRTDFFLDRLYENTELSAGMRRETQENFYTGSLIKSYVQFTLLQGGIH